MLNRSQQYAVAGKNIKEHKRCGPAE